MTSKGDFSNFNYSFPMYSVRPGALYDPMRMGYDGSSIAEAIRTMKSATPSSKSIGRVRSLGFDLLFLLSCTSSLIVLWMIY